MRTLTDHLAQYAAYHRDRRNIATHFVGIPMIVIAVVALLSRPTLFDVGVAVTPALLLVLAASIFYLVLDLRFGIAMAVLNVLLLWLGSWVAAQTTAVWATAGIVLFVVGWIIQFIGHYFEGRKPAFFDDIIGLIIGPLFVVAEVAFGLGLRDEVRREIEKRAGPTYIRKIAATGG
ncbi:MAG TPA: Mpo1-like protein [Burkholderiales bacterium]